MPTSAVCRLALPAVVGLLVGGMAGCSGGDDDDAAATTPTVSTPSVDVPAGVELTDPGSTLEIGKPASAVFAPNRQQVSVVTIRVQHIARGSVERDLANYVLTGNQRKSTPYYVEATVRNDGPGQLGGSSVPLYAFDDTNTARSASPLVGGLAPCPAAPVPSKFGPKATLHTCLVFLVPHGAMLQSIQLRGVKGLDPVSWTVPPRLTKPQHGHHGNP